jgi:hypothetical protein
VSRSRQFSRPLGYALSGLLAAMTIVLSPVAAQAGVKAPTGLSPSGPVSTSTPTFTWNRVSGATGYQVMVDDSSSFNSPLVSTTTANNKFVPTTNLPGGQIFWQVKAQTPNGNSSWSSASATISATAAPSPISPVGGITLAQPDSPPLFTWSAVTGAVSYEIQVDNSGTWTSPTTYLATGTSYFVDTPPAPGTWYWRVRANRGGGLFTGWSSTANYVVGQLNDPTPGADMNSGTPVQDVSIDWLPVPGATGYQLQVDTDPAFNNPVDDRLVDGTVYSPTTTYDNDQYYWRVRAIDAGQNRMPWTAAAPFTFQRNWPQKPTLEYPLDQLAPSVGDPMYYQWTPVKHATRYQLDVSTDSNFSPATIHTCFTTGTTLSPFDLQPNNNTQCGPQGQGVATYWRVRAIDDPKGVLGIFSAIRKYVYDTGPVTLTSPANGATVDVPTLTWNPVRDSQAYEVVLRDKNAGVVADVTTHSTTWTPETLLTTGNSPYSWTVQSIDTSGSKSPLYSGHTFSVSGNLPVSGQPALTPLTGVTGDPATADFPDLTWQAMAGASYYRLLIGVSGSGFWDPTNTSHINGATYAYPAATDIDTHYLSAGQYDWAVQAYNSSNSLIGTSPVEGTFTIKDLADATGQQIALDGRDGLAGHNCDNALGNVDTSTQICVGVPSTPILGWTPVPHAAGYLVYLANDRELTNTVVTPYAVTSSTMWRPPTDLADNTAQDSYYWYIRPCKNIAPLTGCTADPASTNAAATNAFRKQSPAVQLTAPADTASVTSEPSFSWVDYLDTNQAVAYQGGTDNSYQTARTYRIQISQTPTFNSTVDDREVDQPFYTSYDRTLPQGLLYWRVQVFDPASHHLTWSQVRSFSNDQAAVSLAATPGNVPSPVGGETVSGSTPFRWAPKNGAASYTIEVYRNDDPTHSPANLVFSGNTKEPAFVWQNYLPPSSSAYRWRVRWVDAGNQPRPFSNDGRFFVTASSVTLNGPAAGTYQKSNGLYFTWNAAPFAANYRLDIRDANGNQAYSVTTAATANAPSSLNDGSYEWRVTALDPSGGGIAVSGWRSFKIDSAAPTVVAFSPTGVAKRTSKVKATFNEKVKGVTTTSFTLHVAGRTSKLPARVKIASNKRDVKLIPKANLKKGKTYTVKLSKAIHDGAGNHMTTFRWTFTV